MIPIQSCSALAFVPRLAKVISTPAYGCQVDSKDSLENVESKWVGEIAENCQGVKLVLVALKCDLREKHADDEDEADDSGHSKEKEMIDYKQGLEAARRIQALRYLGMRQCDLEKWDRTANVSSRMLCKAQPRCQRSFYGSCPSSPFGKGC